MKEQAELFDVDALFVSRWARYPSKDGRKLALRSFRGSVKSADDLTRFDLALTNYLKFLALERQRGFNRNPKNGSTFFNNWQDWIEMPECEGGFDGPGRGGSVSGDGGKDRAAQRVKELGARTSADIQAEGRVHPVQHATPRGKDDPVS